MAGLRKLEKLGVPTQRPEDYYAEMVKTDDHMRKVRQCLLSRQKMLEQKEKARKMRELKKYGKKVRYQSKEDFSLRNISIDIFDSLIVITLTCNVWTILRLLGNDCSISCIRSSMRYCRREEKRRKQPWMQWRSSREEEERDRHSWTARLMKTTAFPWQRRVSNSLQDRVVGRKGQWRGLRRE